MRKVNRTIFISIIYCILLVLYLQIIYSARLPVVGSDNSTWGTILNEYLNISHTGNGTLRNNSVLTINIVDSAITSSKVAISTINSTHIRNNAITSEKIASVAVNATHIANNSIDSPGKIVDRIISTIKIAIGAITGNLIASDAINSSHILDGSVLSSDISADSINNSHIADNSINSSQIEDGSITQNDISINAVNSTHILDNSVSGGDISVSAVNSSHILDGSIGGSDISAGANITANAVNATMFEVGFEVQTASCTDALASCTAQANCTTGKAIIFGFSSDSTNTCTIVPNLCNSFCNLGLNNCSVSSNHPVSTSASVYIVCGKFH